MKTGAIVGTIAGVAGVVAIVGIAYDETEKEKCVKSGGTWQGLLKTPHCVTKSTPVPVNPPSPPASVTPSNIQVTGANTWTADIDWSAVSGATSYKVLVDGQPAQNGTFPAGTTSATIQGTNPGQQHTVGVAACN